MNTTESGKLSKYNTTFTSLGYTNGASGIEEIRKTNISNDETGIFKFLNLLRIVIQLI